MREADIIAANRAGWNEAAPRHRARAHAELLAGFAEPGHSCLDATLSERLAALPVAGRDVAQLCCNNGRELLSVKNMGARHCVGFDLSDAFIAQARELAAAGGIDCRFERTDVHAIPTAFDGRFDVVLVTLGALCWMPALGPFFAVAARLLRPGGALALYEIHPILGMLEPFDSREPPPLLHSYFRREPFVDEDGLDYLAGEKYASKPLYSFQHTLAAIIGAGLESGLRLSRFEEFADDASGCFPVPARQPARLPMTYYLVFAKEP